MPVACPSAAVAGLASSSWVLWILDLYTSSCASSFSKAIYAPLARLCSLQACNFALLLLIIGSHTSRSLQLSYIVPDELGSD